MKKISAFGLQDLLDQLQIQEVKQMYGSQELYERNL